MKAIIYCAQNVVEAGVNLEDLNVTLLHNNNKSSSPTNPQVATQIGSDKRIEDEQVFFSL